MSALKSRGRAYLLRYSSTFAYSIQGFVFRTRA